MSGDGNKLIETDGYDKKRKKALSSFIDFGSFVNKDHKATMVQGCFNLHGRTPLLS